MAVNIECGGAPSHWLALLNRRSRPWPKHRSRQRKREKAAAKTAVLGAEKFAIEFASVFKPDLKRVMNARGFNNQQ